MLIFILHKTRLGGCWSQIFLV